MNQVTKSALTILIILVSLVGCRKEPHKKEVFLPLSERLKKYFVFQKGSYWVYQAENGMKRDCCYIKEPPCFYHILKSDNNVDSIWECCRLEYGGSFIEEATVDESNCWYDFSSGGITVSLIRDHFEPGYSHYNKSTYSYFTLKNIDILDSIVINQKTFHSVLVTEALHVLGPSDSTLNTHYLVESIGLVRFTSKRRIYDSTCNLGSYHIIQ